MNRTVPSIHFLEFMAIKSMAMVRNIARTGRFETEFKVDDTKVTRADKCVHQTIVDMMTGQYPHISILGEEGTRGKRAGGPDEFWLLMDELDGTDAFTLAIPTSVIMIALMKGASPVKSVIADPFADRLYRAEIGQGATVNAKRITTCSEVSGSPIVDVVTWPHNGKFDMLIPAHKVAHDLHEAGFQVQMIGSIGMPLARVASGEYHATVFPGKTLHDTAPGHLLVAEAGGMVTDLRGEPLHYGGTEVFGHISACNPAMHGVIQKIVGKYL